MSGLGSQALHSLTRRVDRALCNAAREGVPLGAVWLYGPAWPGLPRDLKVMGVPVKTYSDRDVEAAR